MTHRVRATTCPGGRPTSVPMDVGRPLSRTRRGSRTCPGRGRGESFPVRHASHRRADDRVRSPAHREDPMTTTVVIAVAAAALLVCACAVILRRRRHRG